jgi:hypothetical protein
MSFNGTAEAADTTANIPIVSKLVVGNYAGATQLAGTIKDVTGWTRNLSQSELNAVSNP